MTGRSILRTLARVLFGVWPLRARAEFTPYNPGGVPTDLGGAILNIVRASLALVGVLALAAVVWGGFKYMTARGDEQEVQKAKSIITAGIVGVLIIGLAYAIVVFVFQALGR